MMNPQAIIAEFSEIIKNNSEQDLEEEVYKFFVKHVRIHNSNDIYEAIFMDSVLTEYSEKSFIKPFWDKLLIDKFFYIDEEKTIPLKPQKNISSFRIIVGFYIFSQVDEDNLTSQKTQNYLQLGIKYQSFYCIYTELCFLIETYKLKKSRILFDEILNLAQQLTIHLAPGYLMYAKTCWILSQVDSNLISRGLIALYIAKLLEEHSKNEMHNAFFGEPFTIYGLSDIQSLIKLYTNLKHISIKKMIEAQDMAEKIVLSLDSYGFNFN